MGKSLILFNLFIQIAFSSFGQEYIYGTVRFNTLISNYLNLPQNTAAMVSKGDTLKITKYHERAQKFAVQYKGRTGYIDERYIVETPEVKMFKAQYSRQQKSYHEPLETNNMSTPNYMSTPKINKAAPLWGMGIGLAKNAVNALEGSSMTFDFSLMVFNIFFDVGSNYAKGKGEYLSYASSQTTKANKLNIFKANLGYAFNIRSRNTDIFLGPTIGYLSLEEVYEDPVLFDTYYTKPLKLQILIGGVFVARFSEGLLFYLGVIDKT